MDNLYPTQLYSMLLEIHNLFIFLCLPLLPRRKPQTNPITGDSQPNKACSYSTANCSNTGTANFRKLQYYTIVVTYH
ncbi:Hypothetical protein NTJ_01661 [Nesidiocoris tenuis]|uniref:Uncharacterized protein n=1 Tax=Nesidiocoris tenuis TaxID=355587 RepID=A0ABN7A966_9HEMI|nr:Hypothetical protein NTJ_01661 [Nesidiocoris tenuis]